MYDKIHISTCVTAMQVLKFLLDAVKIKEVCQKEIVDIGHGNLKFAKLLYRFYLHICLNYELFLVSHISRSCTSGPHRRQKSKDRT